MAATAASAAPQQIRQRLPVAKSTVHDGTSLTSKAVEKKQPEAFVPPNFTIKDLLGAIPKHCFERSAFWSTVHLGVDLAMIATCVFLATHIDSSFGRSGSLLDGTAGRVARVLAWTAYVVATGHIGTGVWVMAHECGHQAYSPSKTINNTVGWIFHSALLVPYHSWRISHARHHAATGHMTRDEVFVPKTRSARGIPSDSEIAAAKADALANKDETLFEKLDELLEDAPLYNFVNVVIQQLFGWPAYLIRNASGQDYGRFTNHFDPNAPIFDKRHFWQIVASDIGLAITIGALTLFGMSQGFAAVAKYYLIPYLIVNHNLVLITFLQHTDMDLPHYYKDSWTFPRGALCTMDRDFLGPVGNFLTHHISDTHVLHHTVSRIPFYNAIEATAALKEFLGPYYNRTEENVYVSLYKNYRDCKFVEDTGDCVFYKNAKGESKRVAVWDSDSGVDVNGNSSAGSSETSESEE